MNDAAITLYVSSNAFFPTILTNKLANLSDVFYLKMLLL